MPDPPILDAPTADAPAADAPTADVPAVTPFAAQRLLELCVALGSPHDVADVLALVLDATCDLLDCGRASMLLYDTATRQLRFVAATSEETATLARIPVPLHGSLAGTIFRENRALVSGDVQRDTRHFAAPAEQVGYRPRAIAGVPMRIDGEPVGVLEALDPHEGAFSEADIEILTAVAAQAAVAVHAARQWHALERAHARLAELDRLKGRLMALASHESRAPLDAVQAAAQALRESGGPAAEEPVAQILAAVGRMQALARAVAEVGALPEPGAPPDREPAVLQGLLREASHEAHADVRLVLDLPAEPVVVSAHVRRLRLALVHVVAQVATAAAARVAAARVADARVADAEVTVRAAVYGADAVVEVRDTTGPPGAPDAGTPDGGGLGLVVARVLVERDGGLVWAADGGALHVRIPLHVGPAAA